MNPVRERPILFSAPMVRALLDGRKTQTRRVIKPQPAHGIGRYTQDGTRGEIDWVLLDEDGDPIDSSLRCPYGAPGDRLWVRETWGLSAYFDDTDWLRESVKDQSKHDIAGSWNLRFAADYDGPTSSEYPYWRPSIFMPRWASRLTLEVTEVRVERVRDITEEDAIAEGIERDNDGWRDYQMPHTQCCSTARESFRTLWDSINGAESWAAKVWVVGFKLV